MRWNGITWVNTRNTGRKVFKAMWCNVGFFLLHFVVQLFGLKVQKYDDSDHMYEGLSVTIIEILAIKF
jgi:hypothetical protein